MPKAESVLTKHEKKIHFVTSSKAQRCRQFIKHRRFVTMNLKCVELDKESDCARLRIAIEPAGFIDTDLYINRQTLQCQISWPSNYLIYLFQKGCRNIYFCKINNKLSNICVSDDS